MFLLNKHKNVRRPQSYTDVNLESTFSQGQ